MNSFDEHLDQCLAEIKQNGLHRKLRRIDAPQTPQVVLNGKTVLNFSSNDYLGLANHPSLKTAAIEAVHKYGAGAGASRLICGSLAPHHQLEESLAGFKGAEAALTFATGYAAAFGAICSLVGKDDIIVIDKLVHACLVDAAKLSGAKLRVFAHNDPDDLEQILQWADSKSQITHRASRILIVTESVFSMDGDRAPLREIVALKEKYGAWLMVDEAHATGLFGTNRRGLAEELGVSDRIEIQMGTLGKALGASGGYLCGSRKLIDFLVNRARPLIFSTAPVPAAVAAASAAIAIVKSAEGEKRRNLLSQRVSEVEAKLEFQTSDHSSAIIPLIVGDESRAMDIAAGLLDDGLFLPAVRYPSVPRGEARLRLTLSAAHTAGQVDQLAAALKACASEFRFQHSGK